MYFVPLHFAFLIIKPWTSLVLITTCGPCLFLPCNHVMYVLLFFSVCLFSPLKESIQYKDYKEEAISLLSKTTFKKNAKGYKTNNSEEKKALRQTTCFPDLLVLMPWTWTLTQQGPSLRMAHAVILHNKSQTSRRKDDCSLTLKRERHMQHKQSQSMLLGIKKSC